MPSIKVDGMDEVFSKLKALGEDIEPIQKVAVYNGMAVIRDEVVRQIRDLPAQNGYLEKKELPRNVITDREKSELIKHIGIAQMDNKDGTVSTRISFDGYTNIQTKAYPKGIPAILIARAINSGSSVRNKIPFIRMAQAAAKSKAIDAATKAAYDELQKIMEG